MRTFIWSAIALAAVTFGSPVLAADMPLKAPAPEPTWNWTGTYVGLVGGGGWGDSDQVDLLGRTTGHYGQSGGTVGGTSGIQIQYLRWVFGAESDLSWANINGTVASGNCVGGTCFTNLQWFGTSRTRVGYTWDRYMIYGTGGVAYGSVKAGQGACPTIPGDFGLCGTNTNIGWTAGAGVEGFINPMWSWKIEYLHIDLGNHYSYTPVVPVFVSERADMIRVGLNLHLNWGSMLGAQ